MEEVKDNENPQTLLMWRSPLRPFVRRTSALIRFYIIIALLLSIIVVFFSDFILLIPVWVMVFISYVFTASQPPEVTHRITQFGVDTAGATYVWEDLSHFYFINRYHYDVLVLVSHAPYSTHVYVVVPENMKTVVVNNLIKHLIYYDKAPRTFIDRSIDAFARLVPQEDVHAHHPKHSTNEPASQTGVPAAL